MFDQLGLRPEELRKAKVPSEGIRVREYNGPGDGATLSEEEKEKHDPRLDRMAAEKYSSGVGSMIYLSTRSRPDVINTVRELSRYTSRSRKSHKKALMHLLRYIASTMNDGIEFKPPKDRDAQLLIQWYVDASYGDEHSSDGKKKGFSVTGFVGRLCGPVSWGSKMQNHQNSSSMEAEVDAVHDAGLELLWILGICCELRLNPKIEIMEDNSAAKTFLSTGKFTPRSRHMVVRYHRAIDLISTYGWKVVKVDGSKEQIADNSTKNLKFVLFHRFRPYLMGWTYQVEF